MNSQAKSIVVLILLSVAAGGAWLYLRKPPVPAETPTAKEEAPAEVLPKEESPSVEEAEIAEVPDTSVVTPVHPAMKPADLSFLKGMLTGTKDPFEETNGKITGTVIDPNEVPVANATVSLTRTMAGFSMDQIQEMMKDPEAMQHLKSEPEVISTVHSSADGTFLFGDLPANAYTVRAESGNRVATQSTFIMPYASQQSIVLKVDVPGAITGKVVDERGLPVAGAEVAPSRNGFDPINMNARTVTTVADGAFTFSDLDNGTWVLTVEAKGYPTLRSEPVETGGVPVTLQLKPGGGVTGSVYHVTTSQPVAGMRLGLTMFSENYDMKSVTTDEAGKFTIEGLYPGVYTVESRSETYSLADGKVEVSVPEPGFPPANIRLTAGEGGVVRGRVVNARTREGIAGVTVHPTVLGGEMQMMDMGFTPGSGAKSGPDGSFEIVNLKPGTVQLDVGEGKGLMGMSFLPTQRTGVRVNVALGEVIENVEIAINPGATVSGQVTGADGKPVVGAVIMGMNVEQIAAQMVFGSDSEVDRSNFPLPIGPAVSDNEGKFSLEGVSESRVSLMVMSMSGGGEGMGEGGPSVFGPFDVGENGLTNLSINMSDARSMMDMFQEMGIDPEQQMREAQEAAEAAQSEEPAPPEPVELP
ncbi:MAG: hypothetical protein AMXMBFR84_28600 [Candidatus Hydrogenedentota bacterium]